MITNIIHESWFTKLSFVYNNKTVSNSLNNCHSFPNLSLFIVRAFFLRLAPTYRIIFSTREFVLNALTRAIREAPSHFHLNGARISYVCTHNKRIWFSSRSPSFLTFWPAFAGLVATLLNFFITDFDSWLVFIPSPFEFVCDTLSRSVRPRPRQVSRMARGNTFASGCSKSKELSTLGWVE